MKLKSVLKKLLSTISLHCPFLIRDRSFVKAMYYIEFGKFPNLENPTTFNENICKIKLSKESENLALYTDKYLVRSYVEKKIGKSYLNNLYGVYDDFDAIDFEQLPQSFALKATHASGYNVIVTDKSSFDKEKARKKFKKWLEKNYYYVGREKNYKNIEPRIVAEEYIKFSKNLTEYKIFCFYGEPKIITINTMVDNQRFCDIYDENFQKIDVAYGYPNADQPLCDKETTNELLDISKRLSEEFDFVRVDLYCNDGKILFSELTFTSGGGSVSFDPHGYDKEFGKFFSCQQG